MKKVAFLDVVHPVLQEGLETLGWTAIDCTILGKEAILEILKNVNGIVVRSRFPMDETFLSDCDDLEFIARSGAGMENIDVSYCNQRNIALFNAPEGNSNAVGEHALGMILALFNNITKGDKEIREGIWDREGNRGVELDGKTVGIIGYGNNGSAFAKKLRGFDVEVLAYDKFKSGFGNEYVQEVSLSELQQRANLVSLHVPQTNQTIGLISKRFIDQMEQPFYLLNMARGKIVDIRDLLDGIDRKKVLGACLDVLEFEKSSFENMFEGGLDDQPIFKKLLNSPAILLSPHVAGWTVESYYKLSAVLLDKIEKHYNS